MVGSSETGSIRMRLIQTIEKFTDVSAVLFFSNESWMNMDMRMEHIDEYCKFICFANVKLLLDDSANFCVLLPQLFSFTTYTHQGRFKSDLFFLPRPPAPIDNQLVSRVTARKPGACAAGNRSSTNTVQSYNSVIHLLPLFCNKCIFLI